MIKEIELKGLEEKIYAYEAKCGLKVYMWVNEKINSMYASLSVKYGSIDTSFKVGNKTYEVPNGIAHFLEHIKFNIDATTTSHDVFYKLGGDANAFTTFDYTSYLVFATENKEDNLKELLNFVYNPYFTKKIISKEKGIIIEEAKMGLDDPYNVLFFDSLKQVLQKSKYRNTITGTPEEVKSINLEDLKLVYNTFYHPKNMFLTITGNFNPYDMVNVIEDTLKDKKFINYKNPIVIKNPEPKKILNKYQETKLNLAYPTIKFSLKININSLKNYTTLEAKILANLLFNMNFGSTSDFKDELTEKGLINNLNFSCDLYDDTFIITISVVSNYKEEVIKRITDKLKDLSISETDLIRKKNAEVATLILGYEDLETVSLKIQDDILNNGGIVTNLKDIIGNITIKDLEDFKKIIDLNNLAIGVFLPKE